jgi:hypothetical protein
VIPQQYLDKLPAAIDLMARREKVVLDAARRPDFGMSALRDAFSESAAVR